MAKCHVDMKNMTQENPNITFDGPRFNEDQPERIHVVHTLPWMSLRCPLPKVNNNVPQKRQRKNPMFTS